MACQACGADIPESEMLCSDCSRVIDRATDKLLEQYHFDLGPED
jgi:hypothetical protein